MTYLQPSRIACAIAITALVACAHNEVDSPVQSGDSTLFTGATGGPIDHEAQATPKSNSPDDAALQKRQHTSLKTPPGADYGAPTGSSSGSGANP